MGQSLLPVSAAVTGLGVAGLKVATDFETAMSRGKKAITGATGEDFEKLREEAINLGVRLPLFVTGSGGGIMTEMAKSRLDYGQIIDGMSGVLSATASVGFRLSTVSTIVADAITGLRQLLRIQHELPTS